MKKGEVHGNITNNKRQIRKGRITVAQTICYGCMKLKENAPVCEHCGFDERRHNQIHQLPVGTVLNQQYIIGRVLGQGGFGITYIAWDKVLKMPVAIKEYFPNGIVYRNCHFGLSMEFYTGEDEAAFLKYKNRFVQEARALAQLSNIPGVVQVKNYFEANRTAYLVMEYVAGITLKKYISRLNRPLNLNETMGIMDPVFRGLTSVHEHGLIHRDISPDNIMVQPDGGVKIIDFGTARYMNDSHYSKSTEAILKHGYAPMEQYNTKGNVGTWTDVYAACATMYYCLTGKTPEDAPTRLELGDRLPELSVIPGIPAQLVRVMEKGMQIRVSDRTSTIRDLHYQIYRACTDKQGGTPRGGKSGRNNGKTGIKKGGVLAIIAAAACLIICVIAFSLIGMTPDVPPVTTVPDAAAETQQRETLAPEPAWKSNILMSDNVTDNMENPSTQEMDSVKNNWPVFGSTISRSKIKKVTFLDTIQGAPISAWDVSADRNESVLAWLENDGDMYHLYLAADGGINGAEASDELFYHYRNLEAVEFNGCFYTDDSLSFSGMFNNCEKLRELDLSGWNTEKVISMAIMFQGCTSLEKLDISSFNTKRVNNMIGMFNGVSRWRDMDVSHFDTSRVTKYVAFYHQDQLPDGTYWLDMFE